jgi:hypothetical protein
MRDQMYKSYFAGVTRSRKHAFAKESGPKANAIKPTYQLAFMPSFHTEPVTATVQPIIKF